MFDWLKRNELNKIDVLLQKVSDLECDKIDLLYKVNNLQAEVETLFAENLTLEQRLGDSIKIANSKRIVKCDNKRCIDWKDGTCELPVIDLRVNSFGKVLCAEITESIADDLKEPPVKFTFITKDVD